MEPQSPANDAKANPARSPFGRLRRRVDFQRVARGSRKAFEAFTLQTARRGEGEDSPIGARVGFTVTRKVGSAVERNRVRRRLREALRAAHPLEAEGDRDYVLMARREALARPFVALVEDLREAFRAVQRLEKEDRPPGRTKRTGRNRRS
jgi:ribonuclease P protein component